MNRLFIALSAAWLLTPAPVLAQRSPGGQPPPAPSDQPRTEYLVPVARTPEQVRQLYEEIEIMRRILDRALARMPGAIGGRAGASLNYAPLDPRAFSAFSPDDKRLATATGDGTVRLWDLATGKLVGPLDPHHAPELRGPQGNYLKGYGVVYSVIFPWHFQPPVHDPNQPARATLTEWERLRREVRGEKVEPDKGGGDRDVSVAEVVLKALAENGRHFSQLPEGESLTVAVTLLRSQNCAQCHQTGGGGGKGGEGREGGLPLPAEGDPKKGDASALAAEMERLLTEQARKLPQEVEKEIAARKAEVRKQVLMGELHQKQGEHKRAAEAYDSAVEQYLKLLYRSRQISLDFRGKLPERDVQTDLELADLYSKLAQALLAQGQKDRALQTLQTMAEHVQRAGKPEETRPSAKGAPATLSSRLIITAPKKLLDQVGTGKISFEEFRKAAAVEFLDFTSAEKDAPKK